MLATNCSFSGPECHKIDGDWSFVPYSIGGAYSALLDTLAKFRGKVPRKKNGKGKRIRRGKANSNEERDKREGRTLLIHQGVKAVFKENKGFNPPPKCWGFCT